jgi:hypothetical protein
MLGETHQPCKSCWNICQPLQVMLGACHASHVGGIDTVEKPRHIGHKPKFPCNICKGDHLTHLCPAIVMVRRAWSLSEGPSSSVSSLVSQQSNQSLVDEVIMSIPYSADTTLILGGDASLDHVVSHPIQPVVEEVVMCPMQSSTDPTLLLESDQSSKVVERCNLRSIPLFFWGVMHLSTMSLAFPVQYLLNKGAFHSLRVHSLQVLGWFPLIGMILWSLTFLLLHLSR